MSTWISFHSFIIEIEKLNEKKQLRLKETNETKKRLAEYKNLSIQELYELTQRKFLKKIIQICDKMSTTRAYSRAFIFHWFICNKINPESYHTCLRLLCEHEKGFHSKQTIFACTHNLLFNSYYAYLSRIITIIKYGS